MASRSYRYWSLDELKEAVKALEEARDGGAQSASYVGGGSVFYVKRAEFDASINMMYDAIDEREGNKPRRIRKVLLGYGGKGFR